MPPFDTKAVLLQALVRGESYGLELIDRVRETSHGEVVILQGRVYPALRQLEAEGFLESYDGPPVPERRGRPRRYYKITAAGRRAAIQQARGVYGLLQPSLARA